MISSYVMKSRALCRVVQVCGVMQYTGSLFRPGHCHKFQDNSLGSLYDVLSVGSAGSANMVAASHFLFSMDSSRPVSSLITFLLIKPACPYNLRNVSLFIWFP